MCLKLKSILKNNNIYYCLIVLSLILVIIFTKLIHYESKYNYNQNKFILKVINYTVDDNKIDFEFVGKEKIIGTYYFNDKKVNKININYGDTLEVYGSISNIKSNTNFNQFNYNQYMYNKKIFYKINITKYNVIKTNNNIFYTIKNIIVNHIDSYKYSKNYLYVFILGNKKYLSDDIKDSYSTNGISHLFSISGMHISVIIMIILWLFKDFKSLYKNILLILVILFYMFITSYTSSVLRAGLFSIIYIINKEFNLDIKTINILYLELFILIIINPFIVYDVGFQYSYLITLSLIKSNRIISRYNNKLYKTFTISLISFLSSLPITIYNFNQISIISIIINIIFVPIISCIIFPLSLITFIIPYLDYILYFFINIIEVVSIYLANIDIFVIILAKCNILIILLYYIIIILVINNLYTNNLYILLLMLILFIHNNILYFNFIPYYITIDVNQGDSSLIVLPNNKGNILIDTGGNINSYYNMAKETLIPLFKSFGIKQIDYLIITHGDSDHAYEAINLIGNFKIKNCLLNSNSNNKLELSIIKKLKEYNIPYTNIESGDKLNIDNYILYFLSALKSDNENDSSIVTYLNIDNTKMLLMGDVSYKVEDILLKKYNLNNIDILKVGHHGSKTSSSKYFISSINPKYSVISVGKNNIYGHPNNEVLGNLKYSKIYRTDLNGSIMFKIKKNRLDIKTCLE